MQANRALEEKPSLKTGRGRHIFAGRRSESPPPTGNATLTLTLHSDAAPKGRDPVVRDKTATDALSQIIVDGLEDAKAEDIVSIELAGKTTLADRMIIATGRSSVHVAAIADRVVKACREAGYPAPKIEGMPLCDWVLLDARDTIVHIFRPDVRQFYNLEKMWSADRPGEARKK
jgi:ribosome-associated protein